MTLNETDSTRMGDKGGVIEGAPNCSNIISPFTNSRRQWKPHFASSIQASSELVRKVIGIYGRKFSQ